jgi:glutamate-1-semialdehyde 2,1-aminomutase
MDKMAPIGPVYQAGTLSGNPLAMSAGIAALEALQEKGVYETLEARSVRLAQGLAAAAASAGVPVHGTRVGSMMTCFFQPGPVADYTSASESDTGRYAAFFNAMLEQGIYLAPSQFECTFVSLAHSDDDIDKTITAAEKAFASLSA